MIALALALSLIDCHQNGDGFLDFRLALNDQKNVVLTTDTFHTRIGELGAGGHVERLARLTLASVEDVQVGAHDPYLVSFWADASKLEYLDWRGNVVSTVNDPGLHVILSSFHGASMALYEAADTIGYHIEVSNAQGKEVAGDLWYADPNAGDNPAYTCTAN
jgi:hypothetical protein